MPLSEPAPRAQLHRRAIEIFGYHRDDGLFDIEAHLTDQRSFGFEVGDRGFVASGENVHEMRVRLTINEDMLIIACEAATEHGPFSLCPGGAATMPRLAGLTIKAGFLKEAAARLGGAEGCTHLRELLQQIGTTAFQTMWPIRSRRGDHGSASEINSCFAFASDNWVVRQRWPDRYTGPDELPSDAAGTTPQLTVAGSREG